MMPDKTKQTNCNILKVRDDHQPVYFEEVSNKEKFKLSDGSKAQWTGEEFSSKELRTRIEPWLTSLFQLVIPRGLATGI